METVVWFKAFGFVKNRYHFKFKGKRKKMGKKAKTLKKNKQYIDSYIL